MLIEKLTKNKLQLERATQLGYAQPLRSPVGEEVARPLEVIASTENKARVNAEIKASKKYNTNFVKSVNVKYLGIYKES